MAHPVMYSDDDPGLAELRELCLDPADPATDWAEVGELVDTSYRSVAPRRLIEQLDARESPGPKPTRG